MYYEVVLYQHFNNNSFPFKVSFLRSVETGATDQGLKKSIFAMVNHLPVPPVSTPSMMPNGNASNSQASNSNDNQPMTPSTKRSFLNKGTNMVLSFNISI